MAQVDPNIAMGFRPVQIPLEESPLNRLRARAEFENSLLKSQEMQRGMQQRNTLARINATPGLEIGSPEYLTRVQQEAPDLYGDVATGLAQRENILAQRDTRLADAAKRNRELQKETFQTAVREIMNYGTAAEIEADINAKEQSGELTTQQANVLRGRLPKTDAELPAWQLSTMRSLLPPKEYLEDIRAERKDTRERKGLTGEFQNVVLAEDMIAELEKDPTPLNLAKIKNLREQIKAANQGKGTKVEVGVKLPAQEKAFEEQLGTGQAKKVLENKEKAEDAREILETVRIGRDILKSGAITGAGADFFVGLNQALKTAGIDAGYADASANSQAYAANMAQNVGKLIKLFGAGTGLSDADRAFAEKMAGGKINLDRKALEKILSIQERASRNVIKRHNKNVEGIKTNIPLTVDLGDEPAPSGVKPYSDAEKEQRYQKWKAKQGGK